MLNNAIRAAKGETVSAAALWADHAELVADIERKRAELEQGRTDSDDELLADIASGGNDREAIRRRKRKIKEALEDLVDAAAALEKKARAAETKEKTAASKAAWAKVNGLVQKRAAALSKMDRALIELATQFVEVRSLEAQIEESIPRDERPVNFPTTGWGHDVGRGAALRLKLLQPAFDALVNGWSIIAPKDWPTLAALGEMAHAKLYSGKKEHKQ